MGGVCCPREQSPIQSTKCWHTHTQAHYNHTRAHTNHTYTNTQSHTRTHRCSVCAEELDKSGHFVLRENGLQRLHVRLHLRLSHSRKRKQREIGMNRTSGGLHVSNANQSNNQLRPITTATATTTSDMHARATTTAPFPHAHHSPAGDRPAPLRRHRPIAPSPLAAAWMAVVVAVEAMSGCWRGCPLQQTLQRVIQCHHHHRRSRLRLRHRLR